MRKIGKRGNSALVKIRELDELVFKLEDTDIGKINKSIEDIEDISHVTIASSDLTSNNLIKLLKQLSDDLDSLKTQKGLCPQALIL